MHVARRLRCCPFVVVAIMLGGIARTDDKPRMAQASAPVNASSAGAWASAAISPVGTRRPTVATASRPIRETDQCTYRTYGGAGVPKLDLKSAKLGFAQAQKDDSPFHAAQTQSLKTEAKRLGYTPVVSNAAGDLAQQIMDIKAMIADGVNAIIVAPVSSDGLAPALDEAKLKKVPVFTIDRMLAESFLPCQSYIGFAGSDLLDQGNRAGEAMIGANSARSTRRTTRSHSARRWHSMRRNGRRDRRAS